MVKSKKRRLATEKRFAKTQTARRGGGVQCPESFFRAQLPGRKKHSRGAQAEPLPRSGRSAKCKVAHPAPSTPERPRLPDSGLRPAAPGREGRYLSPCAPSISTHCPPPHPPPAASPTPTPSPAALPPRPQTACGGHLPPGLQGPVRGRPGPSRGAPQTRGGWEGRRAGAARTGFIVSPGLAGEDAARPLAPAPRPRPAGGPRPPAPAGACAPWSR